MHTCALYEQQRSERGRGSLFLGHQGIKILSYCNTDFLFVTAQLNISFLWKKMGEYKKEYSLRSEKLYVNMQIFYFFGSIYLLINLSLFILFQVHLHNWQLVRIFHTTEILWKITKLTKLTIIINIILKNNNTIITL